MKFQRIVATGLALVFALVASSGLAIAAAKPAPVGQGQHQHRDRAAAHRPSRRRREARRPHRGLPPEVGRRSRTSPSS